MPDNILSVKIDKLLALYALSVNNCDLDIARTIWNRENAVSFIHPNGYEHSFDDIVNHFYINTMRERFLERKLVIKNKKYSIYNDIAFIEFEWDFYAVSRTDNTPSHTKGRESQFLVLQDENWKITHIHYSAIPE